MHNDEVALWTIYGVTGECGVAVPKPGPVQRFTRPRSRRPVEALKFPDAIRQRVIPNSYGLPTGGGLLMRINAPLAVGGAAATFGKILFRLAQSGADGQSMIGNPPV